LTFFWLIFFWSILVWFFLIANIFGFFGLTPFAISLVSTGTHPLRPLSFFEKEGGHDLVVFFLFFFMILLILFF